MRRFNLSAWAVAHPALILFLIVIVQCIRGGKKATAKVWDDARPNGLEWTLSSPPPYHSFTTAPEVK